MRYYPNLLWALKIRRLAHFELSQSVRMEPSRFSRCLNGRLEFSPIFRQRIAEVLGFEEAWLFAETTPRSFVATSEHVGATSNVDGSSSG